MSTQLIDHNDDLRRLKEEGYNISIVEGNIVIKGIPYVNKDKNILFGTIYCPLTLSGQKTVAPQDHTVRFMGEHPCDKFGKENNSFVNSAAHDTLTIDIIGSYYFSSKPENGNYSDFYAKMTKYVELLSAPAKSLDSSVTAQNFEYEFYNELSMFKYPDTNTARAGLSHLSERIKGQKIAIIGLGGTGSYVLDFVCKTPVMQISIFDGDQMLNHNAFRIPGIMTLDELEKKPSKVSYFKEKYDKFRDGIIDYDVYINETNVELLGGHDFVFIAIDEAEAKKVITEYLISSKIPFVDLGMGISVVNNSLRGTIRRTLITPENFSCLDKIPMEKPTEKDIYSKNIQISELNALNATLGILAWKKLYGFYLSEDISYNSIFIIDEEEIQNEA